ncbi:hypothetical protein [Streptomyces sp. NPDC096311]|uniref:hypothetical protein n=1 Tax=Streptomyces sp. NPDC096311 TaxID=3366083 RepID=UPI00381CAC4F
MAPEAAIPVCREAVVAVPVVDVAHAGGVRRTTVSRVLNTRGEVDRVRVEQKS